MNENKKQSGDWKMMVGGIVLIIVLFVGVKLVFWGLGEVVGPRNPPQNGQSASASQSAPEAPSFCVHCGRELPESFEWGQFCPYCGEKVA